jgi:dihydropteroate synthase
LIRFLDHVIKIIKKIEYLIQIYKKSLKSGIGTENQEKDNTIDWIIEVFKKFDLNPHIAELMKNLNKFKLIVHSNKKKDAFADAMMWYVKIMFRYFSVYFCL